MVRIICKKCGSNGYSAYEKCKCECGGECVKIAKKTQINPISIRIEKIGEYFRKKADHLSESYAN